MRDGIYLPPHIRKLIKEVEAAGQEVRFDQDGMYLYIRSYVKAPMEPTARELDLIAAVRTLRTAVDSEQAHQDMMEVMHDLVDAP